MQYSQKLDSDSDVKTYADLELFSKKEPIPYWIRSNFLKGVQFVYFTLGLNNSVYFVHFFSLNVFIEPLYHEEMQLPIGTFMS